MGACMSGDVSNANSCCMSSSSSSFSDNLKKRIFKKLKRYSSSKKGLNEIPGRMSFNGSTESASLFTKQGSKGINQDSMILWENFGPKEDTIFCGVFDGHGPEGHVASSKVRDYLPVKLISHWESSICTNNEHHSEGNYITPEETSPISLLAEEPNIDNDKKKQNEEDEFFLPLKHSLIRTFEILDMELKLSTHPDFTYSGTTAATLIKQGQHLAIANVGDSRAVLSTRDSNNSRIAVQLTTDHKPNLPREAERIRLCKGRVSTLPIDPDVSRLWLPYGDSPGLAMSRAFGDFCLKDFGLIALPEISYLHLMDKDEFIILATDGIWSVLTNKQAVDIVASAPRSTAARKLVESAIRGWRYQSSGSRADDCAAICLFLGPSTIKSSIFSEANMPAAMS